MNSMGDIIAQRIHEVVQNGKLGYDYTFDVERGKNKALRRKYKVDDNKMREVLLELNGSHYIKSEESHNKKHSDDTVHIFKIIKDLMPRFDENADYVSVCLYIKVTWSDGEEPMFIISFHEDEK